MQVIISHAALSVKDFEWYLSFFEDVLGMEEEKRQGTMPYRKVWLDGGIQLNECLVDVGAAGPLDHIGFTADDVDAVVRAATERGCLAVPMRQNWFILPNGVVIEMKQK